MQRLMLFWQFMARAYGIRVAVPMYVSDKSSISVSFCPAFKRQFIIYLTPCFQKDAGVICKAIDKVASNPKSKWLVLRKTADIKASFFFYYALSLSVSLILSRPPRTHTNA